MEGSKPFFATDYWKLRISLGEDGRTTDWILMKEAKQCSSDMASSGDIVVDNEALTGAMMTSSLTGQNNNYREENPTEGWRKEKKKVREALKKSPAYIRGRLDTPKNKKPRDPKTAGGLLKEDNGEGVTSETTKVEEVTTEQDKVEEVKKTLEEGKKTKKHSNYFEFVKRVLEQKSKRKAEKQIHNYEEDNALAAQTFTLKVEPHIQSIIFNINLTIFTSNINIITFVKIMIITLIAHQIILSNSYLL